MCGEVCTYYPRGKGKERWLKVLGLEVDSKRTWKEVVEWDVKSLKLNKEGL